MNVLHRIQSTVFWSKFGTKVVRTMATIHASPLTSLVDDPIKIKVDGLEPGSKVTVRSFLPEPGMLFEAHGHFVANDLGEVSVYEHPSVGGTFTGVEPMGLLWSMVQSPGQKLGLRFVKRDVTIPMVITLSTHPGHIGLSDLQTDKPVAKTEIQRTLMGENVEIIKVKSGRVRGLVFKPKGPGPFRGVIDIFGSTGGINPFRAAMLASRGFAAYALPYFRYEDLPGSMMELDLDYFEEATDWLQKQSYVRPGGIGLCALSWGAEIATLMAATFPQKISACVSISGSCLRTWCPLSYKGESIPYLGFDLSRVRVAIPGDPPILNTYKLVDPLETAPVDAIIQMEKAQHLLLIVGVDDRNWPAPEYIDAAERRLKALGCKNYEIVRYPNTGHIIEPPHTPVTQVSYNSAFSNIIEWGGNPREQQRAHEDSWRRILEFLNKYIGSSPSISSSGVTSRL